MKFKCWVPKP